MYLVATKYYRGDKVFLKTESLYYYDVCYHWPGPFLIMFQKKSSDLYRRIVRLYLLFTLHTCNLWNFTHGMDWWADLSILDTAVLQGFTHTTVSRAYPEFHRLLCVKIPEAFVYIYTYIWPHISHLFYPSHAADHFHSTVHHEAKSEVIRVYWSVRHISNHAHICIESKYFYMLSKPRSHTRI